MTISVRVLTRERRTRQREACEAIARRLHDQYVPTLAEPLPRELEDLIAQLVAFETRKRGPRARAAQVSRSIMAQLTPRS
jgi:hypothetical protein